MILLFENNIKGGINSVLGDRYVTSEDKKKVIYIYATDLYGCTMIQSLAYDENEFD